MKYALTTFALIITLIGGFIFGSYYMYKKYNPAEPKESVETEEPVVDDSAYYDSDGNWIFKYGEEDSGYGGSSSVVSAGVKASENIDYRITGSNFVYEDDGYYSGFHAVVTVENIGSANLYLGKQSVFDIEDRNLEVVDSYDFVRAVPDVIAPGEKGYFYVPYGQIKTNEDSVTIQEGDLSGEVLDSENENAVEGNVSEESENKAVDIDELEKALGIDGSSDENGESGQDGSATENNSASIKVKDTFLMAAATEDGSSAETSKSGDDAKSSDDSKSTENSEKSSDDSKSTENPEKEESSDESAEDKKEASKSTEDNETDKADSTTEEVSEAETSNEGSSAADSSEDATPEYPGLSLYKVNEYFIMPQLDVQKCSNEPKTDFEIDNIIYGSNEAGNFSLSADVTNNTETNVDYIPVTVVAIDRRGNAIAVGRDSLTDFYSGATKSFGVSYILTREQRSNIVQCVVYARESVSN